MKKIIAFFLSVLMCLSTLGVSVFAETAEGYTVTLYEDSSKEVVLLQKTNKKKDDKVYITFEPTKEGHTFVSWIDDATKEKVTFNNNVIVVGDSDADYYIDWSINSYKLTYRGYGEIFAEYDVVYGTPADDIPVPESVPERDGYEFVEWSALPETMPAARQTVVARWRDTNLEAHFFADLGDAEPFVTVPLLYGDPIFEPDGIPEKTGYTFDGWSFDGENVVSEYELGNIGDEDAMIYAVWTPNKYNATFNANGGAFADGSEKKLISVEYGSPIIFDEIPEKEFFVFNGWTPAVGIMDNINGINFRANWIATSDIYYTVKTYTMGTDGKYTSSDKMYKGTVGETVTANYTVEEGFELNKTKSVLSGVVTTDCSLELKVYFDRKLYDFSYDIDGVKTTETYLYGEKISAPVTPSKEGYTFLGWEPEVPETMPATDFTVTATWQKIEIPDVHTHTEKTVIVNPTCTESGKSYAVCETCGETIGQETVIPATGHIVGEWTVVVEPTYTSNGKKIKKCVTCGVTVEEAVIDKLVKPSEPTTEKNDYSNVVLRIKNKSSATLSYGDTLRVTAEAVNIPANCELEWSVSGEGVVITKAEGNTCEIQVASTGTAMLTVTVVDENGEAIRTDNGEKISDSQNITAKAGIFQKIIAFFKKLFGLNKIIVQTVKPF